MQLERIAIRLRPRQGFEAIDLGFRMALRWAWPLWSTWLAVFLPVAAALLIALSATPLLAVGLLWWLKPMFERFLLHVLSRAVFGETPRLVDTLASWRQILSPGLARSLLARFWDLGRSFNLAVMQLERQTGRAARERRALLGRRAGAYAYALTLVCMHFEMVAYYGIAALALYVGTETQLLPEPEASFDAWEQFFQWTLVDSLVYLGVISLVAPFYAAAGFALYLNRRVTLEGWDLELALRRMAAGVGTPQKLPAGMVALLPGVLLGVVLLSGGQGAHARLPVPLPQAVLPGAAQAESLPSRGWNMEASQEEYAVDADGYPEGDEEDPDPESLDGGGPAYTPLDTPARRAIQEVLADPVYGGEREVMRWVPREREAQGRQRSEALGSAGLLFAELVRVLAWLLLAATTIALLFLLLRGAAGRSSREPMAEAPRQLFGLAIDPQSLPADLPGAAAQALGEGRWREALALLYRGLLSHLVHVRCLEISAACTEGDVARRASETLPPALAAYFRTLLAVWIVAAYGDRPPAEGQVRSLIEDYRRMLVDAAPTAPGQV